MSSRIASTWLSPVVRERASVTNTKTRLLWPPSAEILRIKKIFFFLIFYFTLLQLYKLYSDILHLHPKVQELFTYLYVCGCVCAIDVHNMIKYGGLIVLCTFPGKGNSSNVNMQVHDNRDYLLECERDGDSANYSFVKFLFVNQNYV